MLKDQADRTPSRSGCGWSAAGANFSSPSGGCRPEELNEAAPDTPVFVLHLYDRALLNRAALKAVGIAKRRRIRRAARSSAIATATRPGC